MAACTVLLHRLAPFIRGAMKNKKLKKEPNLLKSLLWIGLPFSLYFFLVEPVLVRLNVLNKDVSPWVSAYFLVLTSMAMSLIVFRLGGIPISNRKQILKGRPTQLLAGFYMLMGAVLLLILTFALISKLT